MWYLATAKFYYPIVVIKDKNNFFILVDLLLFNEYIELKTINYVSKVTHIKINQDNPWMIT